MLKKNFMGACHRYRRFARHRPRHCPGLCIERRKRRDRVFLTHRTQGQQVLNELKAFGVDAEEHATDVKDFSAIQQLFADFIPAARTR